MKTEKEYRIQRLKEIVGELTGKKIALYGTGKNAEEIIEQFTELCIMVLIDEKSVGKYAYGKKIVSFEDALFLHLDIIIIAAEAQTEKEISDRIILKCFQHNIQLFNMYGINVINEMQERIVQDINYQSVTSDYIRQQIDNNDVVCFELMGVLCESCFYSKESMWKYLEKEKGIIQFYHNRIKAERERQKYAPYNISRIYNSYLANTFSDMAEIIELHELEEGIFLGGIVLKTKMIELLQYALQQKKKVYLISDLPYSIHGINKLLSLIGLENKISIIQENIGDKTISAGLIRYILQEDLYSKVFYLGRKDSLGFSIAKGYGFKRCMIKSSLEYVYDFTELSLKEIADNYDKLNDYKSWIVKEFNSPFHQDNIEKKIDLSWKLYGENDYIGEKIDLIDTISSKNIYDFEQLSMPQYSNIDVSIIIPVFNHFDYTYACLQSILKNTVKVPYEVIIADDCSTDLTGQISDIVKGIKVIRNSKNLYFLKNCNNVVKYALGKYIVFLNNDTQVQYNWLYPLFYLLESDGTIGLTGSKLLFPDGTLQEAGGIIYKDGSAANFGRGKNPNLAEFNYVRDVDYISGASIMIRHEIWDELGGFDERFAPAYCEDSDLAFKVRQCGKRVVYQPASRVVHFEGISNGKKITDGIKKYQEINNSKFASKWMNELEKQNKNCEEEKFAAKDRKQKRKTVLFISGSVPAYDRDAGSKSIMCYIRLFLLHDYIVKFWPLNMYDSQPYTLELQQMGVEVLYGADLKKKMSAWILSYQNDIDYAFVNYPEVGSEVIDLLKVTSINIRYYGHDLHYFRFNREYELTKNEKCLFNSNLFYEKEKQIIRKAEWVYYPSDVEVEIVKREFNKENVKQISLYMYDTDDQGLYEPEYREGIMFIGGSHGPNEDAVLWFLTEIYPDIYTEKRIPFFLVGANHSVKLKEIKVEGVINIGYVTEDELTELYHKVRMVVIPLRYGAGVKGKVVDAMYHRVPIISTSIGIEGIPMSETCTKIADNAEMFKKNVINLYDDYAELRRMSDQYNGIIHKHFSMDAAWEKIKHDFE